MKKLTAILILSVLLIASCSFDKETGTSETGTGGSMARFTIINDYLYTVDFDNLNTFNIATPTDIQNIGRQKVGFGIETIFPINNTLFLGARNGMYIYSLQNPAAPVRQSFTSHFLSYDPVVVQGEYAYVTLRSMGWNRPSSLQIYDVSNLSNPILVKIHPMLDPKGLGIDGNRLFICDNVLKVYQISNNIDITLLASFNIQAIDIIPKGERLYVVTANGFYQYSYANNNITFISQIIMP
ncbi:MAG: hypothetical protein U1C46_03015 [Bacteroidales bacterium]|nr:hypothetical protein [Bacteroidales bacterium]MDZ4203769.1 hypothetical protein [Bacteroidales bacterium]